MLFEKMLITKILVALIAFANSKQVLSAILPPHVEPLMTKNCSAIEDDYFPLMKIQHSDEIYNTSFSLIESSDVVNEHSGYLFSITCVAYYPIEWVVNYFYNGYPNGNFGLHLQVHRKVNNFNDPSSYKFTISSKLRYKNTHGFKNFSFSCQSVHRPSCLRTMLFTSFDEEHDGKNGVKVNVIPRAPQDNTTIYDLIPKQGEKVQQADACDFKVYERNAGYNRYILSCKFDDGTPGTVKAIHQCTNAISCMAFLQQHHQPLLSEHCAQPLDTKGNDSCLACHERSFRLSQGFLQCVPVDEKDNHHHHNYGKLMFFFSSVPQESLNYTSKLYFNITNIEPSDMISMTRMNKKVSLGDQINVVCNTSSYYFASGAKFGVKYKGSEELSYIKAIANPSNGPGSEYFPANIYEGNIPITTGTIEKIYCFAPVFNSFVWLNKSIDVQGTVIVTEEWTVSPSPHIAIAVSVTLFVTALFCCLLFGLCWMKILRTKLSKFGKLLTPQEIDEFRSRPSTIFENGDLNDYEYINTTLMSESNHNISYVEIKREQLLLDETVVLGKGHFGKVLKGVYNDDKNEKIDVAVKTLKTKTDVSALKSLLSELKIMASVGKNLNVVNLIGAVTRRMAKGEVYVAVEYCANGNMQNYLRTHRDKFINQLKRDILVIESSYSINKAVEDDTISSLDLIKWSWEIAKGMEFLSSKKVIHSDLACRNILLTMEKVAKVSDFGLSRHLTDYYYVKEESDVALPYRWMAIEALRDMKFSISSDIWSYAVLLYEMFTLGEIPYYGCSWSAEFVQALDSGHRLGKPIYATSEIYNLMRACWKHERHERPSFLTIKCFFEDIITQCTYQDYMQLDLSGSNRGDASRSTLLPLTPTIEVISDCEVEDDVFEQ